MYLKHNKGQRKIIDGSLEMRFRLSVQILLILI